MFLLKSEVRLSSSGSNNKSGSSNNRSSNSRNSSNISIEKCVEKRGKKEKVEDFVDFPQSSLNGGKMATPIIHVNWKWNSIFGP